MDPALEQDEIRLAVPAEPAFARVARQAAGGLAARLGFSYDELDRVRLAVAETWSVLLGAEAHAATVVLRMTVLGPGVLEVDLSVDPVPATITAAPPAGNPSQVLLAKVADEVEVAPDRSRLRLVLRAG